MRRQKSPGQTHLHTRSPLQRTGGGYGLASPDERIQETCASWVDPRVRRFSGIGEIQRQRMLLAMAEVCVERGVGEVTVAHVVERAGVSRKTFYKVFADREDCFLAALEQAVSQVGTLVREAYEHEDAWREGIRAGLAELLVFFDAEPALARLCLVQALGAGPRVLERRARLLEGLAEVVDRGRFVTAAVRELPEVAAEGVVGAVFAVLHTRAQEEGSERFLALLGSLMNIVVLPYMGARAASRELERPAPETGRNQDSPPVVLSIRDLMAGLGMRLTQRTARVLVVIGEHPGASNREIAERSGVADQGQMSNLLARLQNLGFIDNSPGESRGRRNAWTLTGKGRELERSIRIERPFATANEARW